MKTPICEKVTGMVVTAFLFCKNKEGGDGDPVLNKNLSGSSFNQGFHGCDIAGPGIIKLKFLEGISEGICTRYK